MKINLSLLGAAFLWVTVLFTPVMSQAFVAGDTKADTLEDITVTAIETLTGQGDWVKYTVEKDGKTLELMVHKQDDKDILNREFEKPDQFKTSVTFDPVLKGVISTQQTKK